MKIYNVVDNCTGIKYCGEIYIYPYLSKEKAEEKFKEVISDSFKRASLFEDTNTYLSLPIAELRDEIGNTFQLSYSPTFFSLECKTQNDFKEIIYIEERDAF